MRRENLKVVKFGIFQSQTILFLSADFADERRLPVFIGENLRNLRIINLV